MKRQKKRSLYQCIILLLAVLHGMLITLIIIFLVHANYEDRLYDQILNKVIKPGMNDEEKALGLLWTTHELLRARHKLFDGQDSISIRDRLFRSSDVQLIDARGSCGSYTHVLGRLLQRAHFPIRIAQMKCGKMWGCHVLLETNVDGNWVVLDAFYNLAFEKADGSLASFREVGKNWEYYKNQVPANYDQRYAYEDVRYTNWQKIPIVMPAVRNMLGIFLGEKVTTVSLRPLILNVYKIFALISVTAYFFLIAVSVFVTKNRKLFQ